MKKWKIITSIALVLLIIISLITLQYRYSSKTETIEGVEYLGHVEVNPSRDILIFKNDKNIIGFKDTRSNYQWLIEGNLYTLEYKGEKWYRSGNSLANFKEE